MISPTKTSMVQIPPFPSYWIIEKEKKDTDTSTMICNSIDTS